MIANRCSILLFILICILDVSAQNTFSKFYDFDIGIDDRPLSLLLIEEGFVISVNFSGNTSVVSSLIRFDNIGDVQDSIVFPDFVLGTKESIIETDDGYALTGNRWSLDDKDARGNQLIYVDPEFNILKDTTLFYQPYIGTNTRGIKKYEDEILIYFEAVELSGVVDTRGHIFLLDSEKDTIKHKIVLGGESGSLFSRYDISNPQQTPDRNYVFMANTTGSANGTATEVIKITKEGEMLKNVNVPRRGFSNSTLIQDVDNNFYFYTLDTPFLIDSMVSFPDAGGGITKLNGNLDSVIWSKPFNRFTNPLDPGIRIHEVQGLIELSDGHFLAYGEIQDNDIFKQLGFLVKFDVDGEILWSRFFKPTLQNGFIRESVFIDCKELPDGRILCLGESNNLENGGALGDDIWLLMLDEEGCLKPDCEKEQIITNTYSVSPTQSGRIYPNPVTDILQVADVSFDRYVLSDMMGRKILEGGFDTEINLPSSMPSGMYILQLVEGQRLKSVFKFLKE